VHRNNGGFLLSRAFKGNPWFANARWLCLAHHTCDQYRSGGFDPIVEAGDKSAGLMAHQRYGFVTKKCPENKTVKHVTYTKDCVMLINSNPMTFAP